MKECPCKLTPFLLAVSLLSFSSSPFIYFFLPNSFSAYHSLSISSPYLSLINSFTHTHTHTHTHTCLHIHLHTLDVACFFLSPHFCVSSACIVVDGEGESICISLYNIAFKTRLNIGDVLGVPCPSVHRILLPDLVSTYCMYKHVQQ